ncbi:hypothetical protein [Sphingosinicella sp. BN140058]|uniref:hypothetical protein n=1 Tax=Sphingosinicella sp. BN140058 TaxID=1892855 RepID=UPI0010115FA4|nr:hypothetical protein [Sphingosinicella sp. BN140058]QAY80120.1 hypothetical protein ETR14_26115 [Sphingosinicella sp. BN140058]
MKKLVSAALIASVALSTPVQAAPQYAPVAAAVSECGYSEEAPIFGVGMAAGTTPTPILLQIEQQIVAKGDKSAMLRSVPVPATNVENWTSDYALMRLSQTAGRPIWAVTEDGRPGEIISAQIPATNLADAFDRVAAAKGKRWRFDGERVYLLGGREWTLPMPASRDLALAVADALQKNNVKAVITGNMIRFQADDAGVARIKGIVDQVYAQQRLNPYDVKFFKVYPTKGQVDWTALVERTDSVETVSFEGKGVTMVLDPTAGAVIETFLAREGQVQALGSTTMVSAQASMGSSHAAGCGGTASSTRGLELAGGAYERGRVSLSYAILGSPQEQAGKLAVTPGAVVVLADAVPDEGGYMVAIIRPRVLELQGGSPMPYQPQPTQMPGQPVPQVVAANVGY